MKHVEDAMREMVHESMNVFVGEVVKQVGFACTGNKFFRLIIVANRECCRSE